MTVSVEQRTPHVERRLSHVSQPSVEDIVPTAFDQQVMDVAKTVASPEAAILGYNVRRLRMGRRMSVAALAEAAALSRPVVYKVESGSSNVSLGALSRLARALDVSVCDLLADRSSI